MESFKKVVLQHRTCSFGAGSRNGESAKSFLQPRKSDDLIPGPGKYPLSTIIGTEGRKFTLKGRLKNNSTFRGSSLLR